MCLDEGVGQLYPRREMEPQGKKKSSIMTVSLGCTPYSDLLGSLRTGWEISSQHHRGGRKLSLPNLMHTSASSSQGLSACVLAGHQQ